MSADVTQSAVDLLDATVELPGPMALASPSTKPYMLGVPGLAEKSSISLLRKKPVPGTM